MTNPENAPGRAQRLAFQVAAFQGGGIKLARGQATVQNARDATVLTLAALIPHTVFAVADNIGDLAFMTSACFSEHPGIVASTAR